MIELRDLTAKLSENSVMKSVPSSHAFVSFGSTGSSPKNGTSNSKHICRAPPVLPGNISDFVEHFEHTKIDIFSMTPTIGIFILRQKLISFRTSNSDTSAGVVTKTAPKFPIVLHKYVVADKCSSLVPGGVSGSIICLYLQSFF